MNPDSPAVPLQDVQDSSTTRQFAIDAVGIADLRYPVLVAERGRRCASVGRHGERNGRPRGSRRGTHMSRFVETLGEHTDVVDGR